ncbi:hypothetical protein CMUS01_00836 [Colletotrichum musicola]|uniref:Uncharacterized protein n=1 Tax=Colletotrichum musicola TaxID=2175873 RepID=A0A8H6NXV6_9PEZI|nr:hypothetical protein CMUS01_00836 [Colletotrichum musicola]
MAPTDPTAAVKLPASADFNAIYNKIALADAGRASFLKNMRAKHSSLARQTNTSSSPKTASTNGAFSSMVKPTAQSSTQPQQQRTRPDDSELRFENPNSGVGYSAPKAEEQTSAATRDLSRRLLGRRGKQAAQQTVQKRRIQEDESDEEEGRTGLGRKKKNKRPRTEEEEHGEDAPAAGRIADAETHAGESAQTVPGTDAEVPAAEEQPRTKNDTTTTPTGQDTQPETGEAKKKKKKKSKKRKENGGGSA